MDTTELRRHVSQTYTSLRVGMGVLALLLPLVLWAGGLASGTPLQGSLCAYYHTPMRNFFVGILFAIGTFLFLYKGFSWKENHALNLAGIFAILVAVVPMDPPSESRVDRSPTAQLHNLFSALFLLTTACVCIFLASDTVKYVRGGRRYTFYTVAYKLIGLCMATIPFLVFYLARYHQRERSPDKKSIIFFAEVAALCVFGAYWLLKSKEINDSQADWLAKAPRVTGAGRSP